MLNVDLNGSGDDVGSCNEKAPVLEPGLGFAVSVAYCFGGVVGWKVSGVVPVWFT